MTIQYLLDTLTHLRENYPDSQAFATELGLWGVNYFEQSDLKGYYHPEVSWICTDTRVGICLYFLNDEFVCLTTQSGRKMREDFHWVSVETKEKVLDWLLKKIKQNVDLSCAPLKFSEDISNWAAQKKETEELDKKYRY